MGRKFGTKELDCGAKEIWTPISTQRRDERRVLDGLRCRFFSALIAVLFVRVVYFEQDFLCARKSPRSKSLARKWDWGHLDPTLRVFASLRLCVRSWPPRSKRSPAGH